MQSDSDPVSVLEDLAFRGGTPPLLPGDEVHVWSLDASASPLRVADAARTVLVQLLDFYAGHRDPISLGRGEHGKPHVVERPDLQFNLSHAGARVLLAFARNQPLGVDIEALDRVIRVDELARRFFAAAEADALQALAAAVRTLAFVDLWTRKEAVLKAIGQGIGFGLGRLRFAVDAAGGVGALLSIAEDGGDVSRWRVQTLPTAEGTRAAVAWHGAPRRVRLGTLVAGDFACDAAAPPLV